jgi:DNA mismatch repair protein MutL
LSRDRATLREDRPALYARSPVTTTIEVLPDDLVDQIAAGEVVERPASVVKELVENAIDAGAKLVQVDIEGGGVGLIRVSDDGIGMSAEDARLSVRRHATSKIRTHADLERIETMGFRGEALPSIASVSRFSLVTRTRATDSATELRIDGGGAPAVRETSRAAGTTITVSDLFYNVPARRKFLKATATESTHVSDVVLRAALADASLHLVMTRDGKRVRDLVPATDARRRATMLFPDERLSPIEGDRDGVTVRAMLGPPERARSGANSLHVYVNRRVVRDRAIARAVAFAYGSVVPPGRYPVGVVWIEIDGARLDVNVHPQKAEVRFDDSRAVLDAITRALAAGLGTSPFRASSFTPAATNDGFRTADYWQDRLSSSGVLAAAPIVSDGAAAWGIEPVPYTRAADTTPLTRESPAPLVETRGPFGSLRVLGQVKKTFLVCEGESALVVIDQHAADERVHFHRLRAAYESRTVPIQRLLLPERVELLPSEAAMVEAQSEVLASLGIEAAVLGETTVAVRGVPAIVRRASPERLLRDVLAELSRTGSRAFGDAVDTALATMACHGSIRAGDALSTVECEGLLRALDEVDDFSRHCPHGRPIVFEIGFGELGRKVGR